MKSVSFVLTILLIPVLSIAQIKNKETMSTDQKNSVYFIDRFIVPAAGEKEFHERTNISRTLIRNLPGFITDAIYEYTDDKGGLHCVTVAQWESRDALNNAREAVFAEYKKQGFDPAEMFKRLNIVADRGVYTKTND